MAEQPIGGIKLEISGDIRGLQKAVAEGKVSVDQLGKFLEQKIDKSTTSAERSVNRLVKELTGVRPTAQLTNLAVALEKIGGTAKLTETQVGNLQKKIESLKAAGGNVPASLQGLTGLGKALGDIKTDKLEGLAKQMGPLGGALSAVGPAGLAAAAGIAAMTTAVTGLGSVVMDAARWADSIQDTALALGTTIEATQRLHAGAAATEVDFELIRNSIVKMQQALVDSPEKLDNLGLSLEKLRQLAPEEQFEAIATQIAKIEDPARRNAVAIEVFGKRWADLVPFVEAGFDAMKEATVVQEDTVKSLGALKDSADKLGAEWSTLWNVLGGAVGKSPAIVGAIDKMTEALRRMQRAVSEGDFWEAWGNLIAGALGFKGNAPKPPIDRAAEDRARMEAGLPTRSGVTAKSGQGKTDAERAADKEKAKEEKRAADKRQREFEERSKGLSIRRPMNTLDDRGFSPHLTEGWTRHDTMGPKLQEAFEFNIDVMNDLGQTAEETAEAVHKLGKEADKADEEAAKKAQRKWLEKIQKFADALGTLSMFLGRIPQLLSMFGLDPDSKVGRVAGDLSGIAGGAAGFVDAKANKDKLGMVTAGAGALGGIFSTGKQHGALLGGLSGAAGGAAMGSQFGPIGAIAGGAIGLGTGVLGGILGKSKSEQNTEALLAKIKAGALNTAEAFEVAFGKIAPTAISKTTGLLSDQAKKLIEIAKANGIVSESVKQLMLQQAQSLAGNLDASIASIKASREKGGQGIAGQGAATGLSASLDATFQQLVAQGMSTNDALMLLAPTVAALREELTAAGLEGSASFLALERRVQILTGEITGPLVTGIGSLTAALVNMSNLGILTTETWEGLTAQIEANIEALKKEGVEGPDAVLALQKELQTLWELQQKYGFTVDESTQSLIDLGLKGGQIGPGMRSEGEQMKDAMLRVAKAIERLIEGLNGASVSAQNLRKNIDAIKDKTVRVRVVTTKDGKGEEESGPPDAPDKGGDEDGMQPEFATGTLGSGSLFQNFGNETIAALHGLEAVMAVPQLERFAAGAGAFAVSTTLGRSGGGMDYAPLLEEIRGLRRDLAAQSARIEGSHRDTVLLLGRK